jgi:predicted glycosyltransferase
MTFPLPRIMTYSHDGVGLGHMRRNLRLVGAVLPKLPQAAVLMVTGSPAASSFHYPPRVDNLKLPSLSKVANDHFVSQRLGLDRAGITRLRSSLLAAAVEAYEPDLVLVDFYPLGVQGELAAALRSLRERCPNTPVVLGWRDILDSPDNVWRDWGQTGQFEAIESMYEHVLVYGCRDVYDPIAEYHLPAAVARRITFTGYLLAPPSPPRRTAAAGGPTVVCTLGGGKDGKEVAWRFLAAMEHLGPKGWNGALVTGPIMAPTDHAVLSEAALRQGTVCVSFVEDLPALLSGADAVVAMGGYNTVCEVLASGTPAVLVPRIVPRREQLIRATKLADRGLVHMVLPDEATGPRLSAAIEQQARQDRSEIRARLAASLNTDGLRNAAAVLASVARQPIEVAG